MDLTYKYKKNYDFEPDILFKGDYLLIEGESYMENPYSFYLPLMNKFKEYIQSNDYLNFDIKLTYMNTATSKCIYELLYIISDLKKFKIVINWIYDSFDDDSLDNIIGIEEDLDLKINKIKL
jgi:hypothetical protein